MNAKKVFLELCEAGFISKDRSEKISSSCRDVPVNVFRDLVSKIIYLDPDYPQPSEHYYSKKVVVQSSVPRNDMDVFDTERRSQVLRPFIAGKRWLDFGCGPGYQIRKDSTIANGHLGVELNELNCSGLITDGYNVTVDLGDAESFSPQVISMFHVLEHLSNPTEILKDLKKYSEPKATLVVEIPHAGDWLIQNGPKSFKEFTFWSEHLVLHTRQSLDYMLKAAGWEVLQISGVQRYPVWNHLHWCLHNKPTGVNGALYDNSAEMLHSAYQAYLSSRDMTDTLLAIAYLAD